MRTLAKFTSFIDIVLVIVIIIQAFKMMRGTKGILLLNGIVILYLLYILSTSLEFRWLSTLLNWIMMMLIVAIPIIFQNELKRALESLGHKNPLIKWFLKPQPIEPKCIDIVALVAQKLAQTKTGALIVFEREDPLTVVGDSGSLIDGMVNGVLVEQLFFPNSPLHDGAILIRGNRIFAAGCFLPLDNGLYLPQELGSRHRAGLSLSAQSDALIVIVSEETGQIALAHRGSLERNLAPELLRSKLYDLTRQVGESGLPPVNRPETKTEAR